MIIEIEAAPTNPADLLMIQGLYPGVSEFPSRLGIEGVGRVARNGNGVDGLKFGDRVISLARTNWAERVSLSAAQVVPVPKTVDALQLAMLKANPATAHLILRDYVSIRRRRLDYLERRQLRRWPSRHPPCPRHRRV